MYHVTFHSTDDSARRFNHSNAGAAWTMDDARAICHSNGWAADVYYGFSVFTTINPA